MKSKKIEKFKWVKDHHHTFKQLLGLKFEMYFSCDFEFLYYKPLLCKRRLFDHPIFEEWVKGPNICLVQVNLW